MSKNKQQKFQELASLPNVFEYPYHRLRTKGEAFPYYGCWAQQVFNNDHPIVLELGCGRGEYTVGLAEAYPQHNFIGIDIKGNRIWNGAVKAERNGLTNVAFLRTEIELLEHFFAPSECHEIWLTFPDPQQKKIRKRLTSVKYLKLYKRILEPEGYLHLKTDSLFLYRFTVAQAQENHLSILQMSDDIDDAEDKESCLHYIQTYYERQWRQRGIKIKYLKLNLSQLDETAQDTEVLLERDSYRSYNREARNQLKIQ